ncbi:hypothetical protein PUNSTDRAFT_123850, partial [Punctularia strigosozonata HHB-11173 SS5]|uniref:uncharacterized protein n=1 Tax=Punctularia strigosozonata (strain HHB-11173) TaxID=741275 RepID=UPI00044166CA
MSLKILSRNCYQNSLSAAKHHANEPREMVERELSSTTAESPIHVQPANNCSHFMQLGAVLELFQEYPGDSMLQEYLRASLASGLLNNAVYVATLLQAVNSPALMSPATIDNLCRIALDVHYSSGQSPIGSIVPQNESPIVILSVVHDALALLRRTQSASPSHFHRPAVSASELVILLISCVTDLTEVSTTQLMMHYSDVNDILATIQMPVNVRGALDSFAVSLSFAIGDGSKVAREQRLMQTMQLATGKGDILGSNSETDIVSCSLALQNLISNRGHRFGAGNTAYAVPLLVAIYRTTTWPLRVFLRQLFLAAFACVEQSKSASRSASLWRALVLGRLPELLVRFGAMVRAREGITERDWHQSMQYAVLAAYEASGPIDPGSEISQDIATSSISFLRLFLAQLLTTKLIEQSVALNMNTFASHAPSSLDSEAQASYLEGKIGTDVSPEEVLRTVDRMCTEHSSQAAFSSVVAKRFASLATAFDVESLGHLSRVLCSRSHALDILSLHMNVTDLIAHGIFVLEKFDFATVGDPQTAVGQLGEVVLLLQSMLVQFKISSPAISLGDTIIPVRMLRTTSAVLLVQEDTRALDAWFQALFDKNSDGIEDTIFGSTRPLSLLRFCSALFERALTAFLEKRMDKDTLKNGLNYFHTPLLSWTLVGPIKTLIAEVVRKGFYAQSHLEIIQDLLLSPTCPPAVLRLCAGPLLRLLAIPRAQALAKRGAFNAAALKDAAFKALTDSDIPQQRASAAGGLVWMDHPRRMTTSALALARSGKIPWLDFRRQLEDTPSRYLRWLWSEACTATAVGGMEPSRRLLAFTLASP